MESLRRFPLTERVAPVGAVVTHRRYGWKGRVCRNGHEAGALLILWTEMEGIGKRPWGLGGSMAAYTDLIIEYEEI